MEKINYIEDEIISIEPIGFVDMLDIEIDSEDRLFYGNGILTHNSGVQEQEYDHSHIAGGISKIQTADNVISIHGTHAMKERGQMQIQFLKTRSSNGVGQKLFLAYNFDALEISDMDEDAQTLASGISSTAEVFGALRRKNNSEQKSDEETLKPAPSPMANLESLKALIRR